MKNTRAGAKWLGQLSTMPGASGIEARATARYARAKLRRAARVDSLGLWNSEPSVEPVATDGLWCRCGALGRDWVKHSSIGTLRGDDGDV